ncbi:MAG: type II toxin-antitoxin system PemK/MazF family toxin [Actinomycetota bacterium]|nr:type II toxin-antitoxin system PemK/MazF family toxin [Actinomycetota bacterium]
MVSHPRRGEVYWADLEPVVGSQQGGRRPVVVVQNDIGNQHSSTTIVVPLTSSLAQAWYRVNVQLPEGVLHKPSVANCSHVCTIDVRRLVSGPVVRLDDETMTRINEALLVSLGLY